MFAFAFEFVSAFAFAFEFVLAFAFVLVLVLAASFRVGFCFVYVCRVPPLLRKESVEMRAVEPKAEGPQAPGPRPQVESSISAQRSFKVGEFDFRTEV